MANQTTLHAATAGGGLYEGAAIQEGVLQLIYQISPEDKPLYTISGDRDATNPKHTWLIRSRGTRVGTSGTHRAVPEGDQFGGTEAVSPLAKAENVAWPTRAYNYTEIFRVIPRVSESAMAVNVHGIPNLMRDQVQWYLEQFGIYIEERLWNGGPAVAGPTGPTDNTARETDGVGVAISTNSQNLADTDITDAVMKTAFRTSWAAGGRPQDFFSGPLVRDRVDLLAAGATKFLDVDQRRVIATVGVYEGTLQTVMLHLSRDITDADATGVAYLIDRTFMFKAWLRRPFVKPVPQIHGDMRVRIEGEVCLEYGNQAAMAEIINVGWTA